MSDKTEQHLQQYHPALLPPRDWHHGPAQSELDARGIAFFRVGKDSVASIARNPTTGDVRITRKGLPTMVHTHLGWALLPEAAD